MSALEWSFLVILVLNTLFVIGYEVRNETQVKEQEGQKVKGRIWSAIMLLTPVVGPMFLLMSEGVYHLLFRTSVDLDDVIFSKERVRTNRRGDTESEGNVVPIEEALAVSDKDSLRTLIMNVVRGDVQDSLASIALALNSEDSETAHYAATVLRDALNDFREHSQKLYNRMLEDAVNAVPAAVELINYMHGILAQKVFHRAEQKNFVDMFEDACDLLCDRNAEELTPQYIEWLCGLLLDLKEYTRMKHWCDESRELYPRELSTYTCYLKLYFTQGRKEEFFAKLGELKSSDIVIDRETLELIRTFQ